MTIKSNPHSTSRPDVFSRGALELTFRLLLGHNPLLAMDVQNLIMDDQASPATGSAALFSSAERHLTSGPQQRFAADYYHVSLNARTIGKVVEALTLLGQSQLDKSNHGSSQLLIIRTLMKDWMTLAEWLVMQADCQSQTYH